MKSSKKYKHILAIDPSGNFSEGKGTTGWVLLSADERLLKTGMLSADDFSCAEEYWDEHINLIRYFNKRYEDLIIVIEDYILYKNRSKNQTNSRIETCRLIGVIQHFCWRIKQDYSMQLAASVKDRWSDDVLIHEKILYRNRDYGKLIHLDTGVPMTVPHIRDAFRHAMHYAVCRNEPKERRKYSYATTKRSNY